MMDDKDEVSEPETETDTDTDAEDDDDDTDVEEGEDGASDIEDDGEVGGEVGEDDDEPDEKPIKNNDFSDDDTDEDNEAEDDNYLQKMDADVRRDIISEHHPELSAHNYEEVGIACNIVRDENGVIIDPLHLTFPFLTRYEKARILGERAAQINSGAKPFVEVDARTIDGYLIALREYEEKKIPFIIRRPLPNGKSEYWRFADLEQL
jgi:DNA-directed RNA polymerase I, II, and III subunit RPABC2